LGYYTKEITSKLDEYTKQAEGIDKYDVFLNKRSFLYHKNKIVPKINEDFHEYISLIEDSKHLTVEELDKKIKDAWLTGIRTEGFRGEPSYERGRDILINELVKQFDEVEETISKKNRQDFRIKLPMFS